MCATWFGLWERSWDTNMISKNILSRDFVRTLKNDTVTRTHKYETHMETYNIPNTINVKHVKFVQHAHETNVTCVFHMLFVFLLMCAHVLFTFRPDLWFGADEHPCLLQVLLSMKWFGKAPFVVVEKNALLMISGLQSPSYHPLIYQESVFCTALQTH